MGSHLFSLGSDLGGLFSENLGSVSCGPHSTGEHLQEARAAHACTDLTPAARVLRQG